MLKLIDSPWQVGELILEDDAHVVKAFLNHIVRVLYLFFGLRNLLEVIFLVVRIFGTLGGLLVDLSGVVACHQGGVVAH